MLAKLLSHPFRRVIVVGEDGRAEGVIGDQDLLVRSGARSHSWLARLFSGKWSEDSTTWPGTPLTAATLMNRPVLGVHLNDPLTTAIRLMISNRVKRLVVFGADEKPVGMVDRRAILEALAGQDKSAE